MRIKEIISTANYTYDYVLVYTNPVRLTLAVLVSQRKALSARTSLGDKWGDVEEDLHGDG